MFDNIDKTENKRDDARERDDIIIGRNSVSEALRSGRAVDTLLVARGERSG
ncbi:MAG: 23S rRNA (guanosine(2251)-2'-O)-methyltransferase RlmB, partial [Clostridiales bacterium]|nr:23S rRNA (guanosine(2251)-2'-O)-methyltransferase RlmB [Clostridiales bacterium]